MTGGSCFQVYSYRMVSGENCGVLIRWQQAIFLRSRITKIMMQNCAEFMSSSQPRTLNAFDHPSCLTQ
jgi:hypothetical protein